MALRYSSSSRVVDNVPQPGQADVSQPVQVACSRPARPTLGVVPSAPATPGQWRRPGVIPARGRARRSRRTGAARWARGARDRPLPPAMNTRCSPRRRSCRRRPRIAQRRSSGARTNARWHAPRHNQPASGRADRHERCAIASGQPPTPHRTEVAGPARAPRVDVHHNLAIAVVAVLLKTAGQSSQLHVVRDGQALFPSVCGCGRDASTATSTWPSSGSNCGRFEGHECAGRLHGPKVGGGCPGSRGS